MKEDGWRTTWGIFSATEVGAPHRRKRIFIMGDSEHAGLYGSEITGGSVQTGDDNSEREVEACKSQRASESGSCGDISSSEGGGDLPDPQSERVQGLRPSGKQEPETHGRPTLPMRSSQEPRHALWDAEPDVGRVVDGCPNRVDRIRLLGNGVVPQTAAKAWQVLSSRFEREKNE